MIPKRARAIPGMIVVAVVMAALVPVPPARAATFVYPGPGPCAGTLQQCINSVPSGSRIQVKRNVTLDSKLRINKSLTLTRKPGTDPTISSPDLLRRILLKSRPGTSTRINIFDLDFSRVRFEVDFEEGRKNSFRLTDSEVIGHPDVLNGDNIIGIFGPQRQNTYRFTGNRIVGEGTAIQIVTQPFTARDSGPSRYLFANNEFESTDPTNSQGAILLRNDGLGFVDARIYNNIIHGGWGSCFCGFASAIGLRTDGDSTTNWTVAGNTIDGFDKGGYGIFPAPEDAPRGTINVHDNIVVRTISPFRMDEQFAGVDTSIDFNDFYDYTDPPSYGGNPPGTVFDVDPMFVNEPMDNYRLAPGSPLVNVGSHLVPGSVAMFDADEQARVEDAVMDLGAYELGTRTRCSIGGTGGADVLSGRPGPDIICGDGGGDTIRGGSGDDVLKGGGGEDVVVGDEGKDRLFGGLLNDRLNSRDLVQGNDRLNGGSGEDVCRHDRRDRKVGCP
jgi:hypothetical protein